jgi:hypothetical protein
MSAVAPQQRGVQMFLMPEAIVQNGSLRTLSGDALALFIAVTHRMYRMRSADIKMSLRDLYTQIELGRNDIQKAAKGLRAAGLVHFQQSENLMMFQIQQADGSKARTYLHPAKPVQDANIAQTNIEVVQPPRVGHSAAVCGRSLFSKD